jgi:medium-chain acyl-[acyl-carrier-protein] hydrolase
VNETYNFIEEPPIDVGISAFGGLADIDVGRDDVEAWNAMTRGRFRMRMMPGDHFFLHPQKDLILESVARDLAEIKAL